MDYKFKNSLKTAKIVIPYADLKEGTPISISGAVTNGSGAFGIVKKLGDKFVGNGGFFCEAEVIVAGYLDENECEKACGLTYTAEMKSALPQIVFVDEFLPETPDELPTVGVGDTGKVLTVGASGLEWGNPLPVPTTEGDVLAVGKVADPSVVILPEQTVEIEEGETYYLPTGGDPTLFVVGAKVCVTVNNESVVGVVVEDDAFFVAFDHECAFVYDGYTEKWMFYDSDSYYGGDPITISVTGTKNAWTERTNDADVIIKANFDGEGEYVSTEVLKSDPNILQRFLSDPSSVRPFVFKHITEISDSMYPFVSVFNYDGTFSIIAYNMYVRGTLPTFVDSAIFIYEDGTWVYD